MYHEEALVKVVMQERQWEAAARRRAMEALEGAEGHSSTRHPLRERFRSLHRGRHQDSNGKAEGGES